MTGEAIAIEAFNGSVTFGVPDVTVFLLPQRYFSDGSRFSSHVGARMRVPGRRSIYRAGKYVAFVLLAIMVFQLARDLHDMRDRYSQTLKDSMGPRPGSFIPSVQVRSLTGESVDLTSDATRSLHVLYFFTTSCPFCRESIPVIKRLSAELPARFDLTVNAVSLDSLDSTQAYVRENRLQADVFIMPERRSQSLLRVNGVPLLLVVGEAGEVKWSRVGALRPSSVADSIIALVDSLSQTAPKEVSWQSR